MRIEITDRFLPSLDDVALRSPAATFYHTSTWIESLIRTYPAMEFHCLVARSDDGVVGYLPFFATRKGRIQRLWSLPFGTYGGPAVVDEAAAQVLVDAFLAMRRDSGVYELGVVDFAGRVQRPLLRSERALTHVLELTSEFKDVWVQRFDKSKRRQTRKARREGIDVTEARTVEEVKSYYAIYASKSRQWRQHVVYPESLFIDLFERGADGVKLFLARSEDQLLGGHLNFYFKDTVVAWNGVTTDDSRGMQASTLLYASCIRHACDSGYKRYNLGASLGKTSLMEYKESLGGVAYSYSVARWRSLGIRIAAVMRRLLPRG